MTAVRKPPPPAEAGFTLIEMMIALLIFGLLAAAGASMLAFGVRAQAVAGRKFDDVAALYRLDGVLTGDLAQAVSRSTRDMAGGVAPAFGAGSGATFLRLTRRGWENIDGASRASLQRVDYVLGDDGAIARVAYPMLDGAVPLPPAAMLDRVAGVTLRYRLRGAWSDTWKPTPEAPLPDTIELTITRRDQTVFRELFLVGTGNADPGVSNAR